MSSQVLNYQGVKWIGMGFVTWLRSHVKLDALTKPPIEVWGVGEGIWSSM